MMVKKAAYKFLFLILFTCSYFKLYAEFGIGLPSVIEKRVEKVRKKVDLIEKPEMLVSLQISPTTAQLLLGATLQFSVIAKNNKNQIVNVSPLWYVEGDIGTITNTGLFTATKIGIGKVKAEVAQLKAEAAVIVVSTSGKTNNPPAVPVVVEISSVVFVNTTFYISFFVYDSDEDDISLVLDWGDGVVSSSSFFASLSTIAATHIYFGTGTYKLKVKAIDIWQESSNWSEEFEIFVTSQPSQQQSEGFKLVVQVQPVGAGYVTISPLEIDYIYGTTITLTAVPNQGYEFSGWSGNITGQQNPLTFIITEDILAVANFIKTGETGITYTLTTLIEPEGSGVVVLTPAGGVYPQGTVVSLLAQANPNYTFEGWSGNLSGTQNPAEIVMNSNKTVRAIFTVATYSLNVNINPVGAGIVSLNPSGGYYIAGTTVTLTALPNSGYTFISWSGDIQSNNPTISLIMDTNKNITANFEGSSTSTVYSLTININPSGAGTVVLDPIGGVYQPGTQVTLTAIASGNYEFAGWSGDINSYSNPYVITMNSNKTITANFSLKTYTLSTSVYPLNAGTVELSPSGGVYTAGTEVIAQAVANSGYTFFMWLDTDIYSRSNPISILINKNTSLRACFMLTTTGSSFNVYSDQGSVGFVGSYSGNSTYTLQEDLNVYKEGTKSMRLTVNSSSQESYAGWYVEEGNAGGSEVKNMSGYSYGYLRFWVKGQVSSNVVVIILSDNLNPDTARSRLDITKYGYIGNDTWQDIAVPLQDFKSLEPNLDFTQIEVYFSIAVVGPTNGEKSIWIDNVRWTTGEQDTPPSIIISNLTNGTTVSGLITITATASDDVGISKVEFYIDNQLKATDTQPPYTYIWYTTSTANGFHTVKVVAYDTLLQTATAQVDVYVNNVSGDQPPQITITNPTNNQTVSGTVNVTVSVYDDIGIQKVEYYIDDVLKYTATTSPYNWIWYTTTTSNTNHILKAVVYDTSEQTSYHQINVFVNNITYTLNIYNDNGISGNDIWTWSDNNQGSFLDANVSDAPEGTKAFITNTNAGSWAGWGVVYTPTKENLSQYSGGYLTFWVKTPVNLKVEIRDTQLRGPCYISQYGWNGTNIWQQIIIPLSSFGSVDYSNIEFPFMITCETQTTFYVDDVKWVK